LNSVGLFDALVTDCPLSLSGEGKYKSVGNFAPAPRAPNAQGICNREWGYSQA
jgi:hypothetical protein